MRCNWCGEGIGKNYMRDIHGKLFYYFCVNCVKDYRDELGEKKNQELISEFENDLDSLRKWPSSIPYSFEPLKKLIDKWEKRAK